ncbi:hypothetical protein [Roseovarius gaetbuli]
MPRWAQLLGEGLPLTHFLRLVRAIMLKGAQAPDVARPILALVVIVLAYAVVALLRFRRTLD